MIRSGAASIRWGAGAFALSLVGHVVSYVSLPGAHAVHVTDRSPRVDLVELLVLPPEPEPTPPPPPRVAPPDRVDTPQRTVERPTPTPQTTPELPSVAQTVPTQVEPQNPETTPPDVRHVPILDAAAAARTVMQFDGPRQPRPAATTPDVQETPEQMDRRLSHTLSADLNTQANARPEGFGPRVLPTPQRRPNGTLAYPLGQVTAIVNPDGSFTFDDTSGVHFDGMGNSERTGGMQASWGLEEWMMRRHGDDPHAATRRWFANQTQEMRDGMEERYMQTQATRAASRARVRLDRILADTEVAIEERRRRIFHAWDECAEGELAGDAVRAAVVAYVREHLAQGSENAYSESELDSLNRSRTGTAEFRPYAN